MRALIAALSRAFLGRHLVALAAMTLILAADYPIRQRSLVATLSSQVDYAILAELAVFAVMAALLALKVSLPIPLVPPNVLKVAAWGFPLTMAATAAYSPFLRVAIARGFQFVVTALLAYVIAHWASRADLHRFAHAYIVLVVGSIFCGLAFPKDYSQRFTWLYVHPVIAGSMLAIALALLVAYRLDRVGLQEVAPWPTWVYSGLTALVLGALLATRTRGALGAAAVGCSVIIWTTRPRSRRADTIVLATAGVAAVMLVFGSYVTAYVARGESAEKLASLNSRTEVWSQAWDLFTERPLFGHGLTASRGAFVDEFGLGGAHNALFEVLVDAGLVGAVWFVVLILAVLGQTFNLALPASRRSPLRHGDGPLLAGLTMVLVVNAVTDGGVGQAANVENVWLFVVIGWVLSIKRTSVRAGGVDVSRRGPVPHVARRR
jgi:O-antigen ligase